MDIRPALKSQYHAALETLRQAIENAPDAMWSDPGDGSSPFWRVVYHTLFFTDLYLRQNEQAFSRWARHREDAQFISSVPEDTAQAPKPCQPFTREDVLEYWRVCDGMVDAQVDALDLTATESGFDWYSVPKLEHQIINIRHIQHHAAILSYRLRKAAGIEIDWVSSG
jgi:hypothetical protein